MAKRTVSVCKGTGKKLPAFKREPFFQSSEGVMSVEDIDDHRPHLTIHCENAIHVLPVATLQNVIDGKFKFTDIDKHEDLIKPILADYLDSLGW